MKLDAKDRNALSSKSFADPSERKFPLTDPNHVRSALSYIRYANPETASKIRSKAAKMGIGAQARTHARIMKEHQKKD